MQMEEDYHLMVVWVYSPLVNYIKLYSATGKLKEIKRGREEDFLSILNEYANLGYEVISLVGQESTYRALLRKK